MTAQFASTNGTDLYIDGKKVIKGWESFSGWYWFATEVSEDRTKDPESYSIIDGKAVPDTIYFGYVQGLEDEWGDFSEAELNGLIAKNKAWRIPAKNLAFSGRRPQGVPSAESRYRQLAEALASEGKTPAQVEQALLQKGLKGSAVAHAYARLAVKQYGKNTQAAKGRVAEALFSGGVDYKKRKPRSKTWK